MKSEKEWLKEMINKALDADGKLWSEDLEDRLRELETDFQICVGEKGISLTPQTEKAKKVSKVICTLVWGVITDPSDEDEELKILSKDTMQVMHLLGKYDCSYRQSQQDIATEKQDLIDFLEEQNFDLNNAIMKVKTEINQLRNNNDELRESLSESGDERDSLEVKIKSLEEAVKKWTAIAKDYDKEIERLQTENKALRCCRRR